MPEGDGIDNMAELDLDSVDVGVGDMHFEQQIGDVTTWSRSNIDGVSVQPDVIGHAIAESPEFGFG